MARQSGAVLSLALLSGLCSACTHGAAVASERCDLAPPRVAGVSHGLVGIGFQFTSFDGGAAVSAVPGTRQAWALGGAYRDPDTGATSLLHFSGLNWRRTATFGPLVRLAGVSAVSGSAAWVWGEVYPNQHGYRTP